MDHSISETLAPAEADGRVLADAHRQTVANFPWYRALSGGSAAVPENLADLPLVTETVLDRHYYAADHSRLEDARAFGTSGTTGGVSRQALYSPDDFEAFLWQREATFRRVISDVCRRAAFDLGRYGLTSRSAELVFERMGLDVAGIDFRQPVDAHVEHLNRFRPDVLFTMPMILDRLLATGALRLALKKLIVVGDIASQAWLARVGDALGLGEADMLNVYGGTEIGTIAESCAACRRFHFHDHVLAEALDPRTIAPGMSFAADERLLVLTSAVRAYFPAVRFVTYDLVAGFGVRECGGRSVPSFDRITGRIATDIKHGERLSLYDVADALARHAPGRLYEVRWSGRRFEIRIAADLDRDTAARIRNDIRAANPDVAQMIDSRLVGDIDVRAVDAAGLRAANKRSVLWH